MITTMVIIIISCDICQRLYTLQMQNKVDSIRNNKADNRAHMQVNTHTVRSAPIEPLPLLLPEHLQQQDLLQYKRD